MGQDTQSNNNNNNTSSNIFTAPEPIIFTVLNELAPRDILAFGRTNKAFQTLTKKFENQGVFWKKQLEKHYPQEAQELQLEVEWGEDQGKITIVNYYEAFRQATNTAIKRAHVSLTQNYNLFRTGNQNTVQQTANSLSLDALVSEIDGFSCKNLHALPQSSCDALFQVIVNKAKKRFSRSPDPYLLLQDTFIAEKSLISHIAKLNQVSSLKTHWQDKYHNTIAAYNLLAVAVQYNRTEIIDFLLEKQVSVGDFILVSAACHRTISIALFERLLEKNSSVSENTLLQHATNAGDLALVEYLLSRPNAFVDPSTLEYACLWGHYAVVKKLLTQLIIGELITSHGSLLQKLYGAKLLAPIKHNIVKQLLATAVTLKLPVTHQLLATALENNDETNARIALCNLTPDAAKSFINDPAKSRYQNKPITLLHLAINQGYTKIVKHLLRLGADLNQTNTSPTPLLVALSASGLAIQDITAALINHIAGLTRDQREKILSAKNTEGYTPISLAIRHSNWKAVNALLAVGANPNEANINSATLPAYISVVDTTVINCSIGKKTTLLAYAIQAYQQETIDLLLKKSAEINPTIDSNTDDHYTPLMAACARTDIRMATLLIQQGAKLDVILSYCGTLLHLTIAYYCNSRESAQQLVTLLLDKGFPLNLIDKPHVPGIGNTALQFAIANNDIDTVKCLLNAGANINFQSPEVADTPLLYAIKKQRTEIVKLLLTQGANTTIKEMSTSLTPLQAALDTENITIIRLVLAANDLRINQIGKGDETALHYFLNLYTTTEHSIARRINQESITILTALLNALDIDVHSPSHGQTPLYKAIRSHTLIVVEKLLQQGADPNGTTPGGEPLLHYVIVNKNAELLELLLKYGIAVNITHQDKKHGDTPLQWAISCKQEAIARRLLTDEHVQKTVNVPKLFDNAVNNAYQQKIEINGVPSPSVPETTTNRVVKELNVEEKSAEEALNNYWNKIIELGSLRNKEALTFRLGGEYVVLTNEYNKELSLKLPKHTVKILEEIINAQNSTADTAYQDALKNVNKIFQRAVAIPKDTHPLFFLNRRDPKIAKFYREGLKETNDMLIKHQELPQNHR